MLEYNSEKNILYAYKNTKARPEICKFPEPKPEYTSFKHYIENVYQENVRRIFLPAFKDCLTGDRDTNLIDIPEDGLDIKLARPGHFDDTTMHIRAKFDIRQYLYEDAEAVSILKIPTVNEEGIIEYDGKKYAFIHMLEQESGISYEPNEGKNKSASIKIISGKTYMLIEESATSLSVKFSDLKSDSSLKNFKMPQVISAMCREEGFDPYEVWKEYSSYVLANLFKDDAEMINVLEYFGGNKNTINAMDYENAVVPRLKLSRVKANGEIDKRYDNSKFRYKLNEMLSLDRAIGQELALDVYSQLNPEIKLADAGVRVDAMMLDRFMNNGVYKLYVKNCPSISGNFLAEQVIIRSAPAGLKLTDELRPYFPDENGMYLSKDYTKLETPIIYDVNEPLTEVLVNLLMAIGYDCIKIKDKKVNGRVKTLYMYEEIISNRQFKGIDIGLDEDKWYYLNCNNEFVENDGSYTAYDFVSLQSFATKLFEGKWVERVVNSDVGFRKRVVPLHEMYERAFSYAVSEGLKQMSNAFKLIWKKEREKLQNADAIENKFYPLQKNFWKYLRDEARCIVQLIGDTVHNPIAYQSALTKVNVYTANKHSVADKQRQVAIGSYGKLDPFEIPQSQKMGTVHNSACEMEIDLEGNLGTRYFMLKHMGNQSKIIFGDGKGITLSSEEEENSVIADITSIDFDEDGNILDRDKIILCRVPTTNSVDKQTFAQRRVTSVKYVNVNANQPLSYASASIPFMSSNDAARAIFAVAQMKQAKGLVYSEEPDVMTSMYEQFAYLNNKFAIVCKNDGVVSTIEYDRVSDKYYIFVDTNGAEEGDEYTFDSYFDSGYSVTKMKLLVKKGQEVKKGDILVSSNFISDRGILSFGVNVLTGYICDGYNYEDGAHISKTLCNRLTSYRVNQEDFEGNPNKTSRYDIKPVKNGRWLSKDYGVFEASYIDAGKLGTIKKPKKLSSAYGFYEDKTAKIANDHKRKYGQTVSLVSVDEFKGGDKNSNRHGNKGVLSRIEEPSNMPRLRNGMPLEACLNPLGVGSRMNIGQVKEIHLGLIMHVLGMKISTDAYNSISEDEIRNLMSFLVDLMNSEYDPQEVYDNYNGLIDLYGDEFFEHCTRNIKSIRRFAGCFDKSGTTTVMLPDNNGRMTETRVLIGWVYMFKLIQESATKLHARGGETVGERYGEVSDGPTKGSSRGGGQRFGTMEMDALCAYGVSDYIQEITNIRCDNGVARNNFYAETYLGDELREQYILENEDNRFGKGQRRSVTQFLYSLLALGVMTEADEGEIIPLSKQNGDDIARWKSSVLQRASSEYALKFSASDFVKDNKEEDKEDKNSSNSFIVNKALILGKSF